MKAMVFEGEPGQVRLIDKEIPRLANGEALIEVTLAGICGTDIALTSGKMNISVPVIPGHEFVGRVANAVGGDRGLLGRKVVVEPTLSCGQCQSCRLGFPHVCNRLRVLGVHADGAFAEYVKVPIDRIHEIPDDMPDEMAVLAEPVAVAIHSVRRAGLEVGERVLVVGAGPIGLLIAQVCRYGGAGRIVLLEVNQYRLTVARGMGFEAFDPRDPEASAISGMDIAFEASGTAGGMEKAFKAIRARARLIVVGLFKETYPVEFPKVLFKELEIRGSRVYGFDDFPRAIQTLVRGHIDVSRMITHTVRLEELERGIYVARQGQEAMKVLVDPQVNRKH